MASEITKVRVLIPDTEEAFDGETMFSDTDIEAYLEIANGSVLRAASYAVMAIATSEALISKVIKTYDLSTNGAAVSDALVKKADALAKRADKEEANDSFYMQILYPGPAATPELTEFGNVWYGYN